MCDINWMRVSVCLSLFFLLVHQSEKKNCLERNWKKFMTNFIQKLSKWLCLVCWFAMAHFRSSNNAILFRLGIQFCSDLRFNFVQTYVSFLLRLTFQFCSDLRFNSVQNSVSILFRLTFQFCSEFCFDSVQTYAWILFRHMFQFCSDFCLHSVQTSFVSFNCFSDKINILEFI